MPATPQDQIANQIESAKDILILTRPKASGDAVAASWGLFHLLKNLRKNPVILKGSSSIEKMDFLPKPDKAEEKIRGARDFVLSFNTTRNKIIDFRSEKKPDSFDIYITPENETVDPRDFSFIPAKFKYDLVVILGCQNLDCLGDMREKNADLFFEVPLINIDNSSANENYAQINLVDITSSSVAEMIAGLIKLKWERQASFEVVQCLLTGLVSATANFQEKSTTPQTFLTASWLIEKGASQQEIIRNIFKTQSFSFLKLWGRVMARLNWDEKTRLAWSMVSIEDFVQSRTKPSELSFILEKIKDNFSSGKMFSILYSETLDRSIALLKNTDPESLRKFQKIHGGEIKNGHIEIIFEGKNILEAEKELLEKISTHMSSEKP